MTTLTRYPGVTASGVGPALRLLRNLVDNPRAVNATSIAGSSGTGGIVSLSRPTTDGPLATCPSFARLTWTTAPTANTSAQFYNGAPGKNLVTAGKTYILRAYVRASWAAQISPKIGYYGDPAYISGATGTLMNLVPNTWTPYSMEVTIPAGVVRAQINADPTGTVLPVVGSTLDFTGWFLFEKPAGTVDSTTYGDGDLPGWAWDSVAHASPSSGYGAIA
jgi:hypothetical protein